ncbi:MAG: metal ABC transporter ATP-binding protein [Deltaproteobacteria bacterium]|nr:MAG: metal ABC transporter ATP-binding protein [Deltaproteobacteria bacterium]
MSVSVRVENLSVSLGGKKILEGVTFSVQAGSLTALIGPNGAGKTTLLRALMKTVPFEGSVSFLRPGGERVEEPSIGYVPQKVNLDRGLPLTVVEFLSLGGGRSLLLGAAKGKERRRELLSRVGAGHLSGKKLGDLSGGELQRVLLARALVDDPDILLLDEPASGIDVAGEELFCEMLESIQKETGKTVLLVSHDLSVVTRHADSVICLDRTVQCQGPPVEIMTRENLLTLFGPHSSLYLHGSEHETCDHDGGGGK